MDAALNLGSRSLGLAAPNPAVGAILVKDGAVIGRGATAPGGRPHAERIAIAQAGEAARGATLYVTLEPCSHFGASPPCVDAIIAAGVARVVSAMEDPNPLVAGQGHARLRAAGIAVSVGAGAAQARRDHLGHILRVTAGRPCVTLKLAETADGFASAGANDARLRITGPIADLRVQVMRSTHEAIMVGVETALVDDPALTVRLQGLDRKPLRVVLDTHLRLPERSRVAATAGEIPNPCHHGSSGAGRSGSAARKPRRDDRPCAARREGPSRSPSSVAGARGARDHPRVQRRRPAGRRSAYSAWPRRRDRHHHSGEAARSGRRACARLRGPGGAARRLAISVG